MEPEGTSPYTREPATCPYPEPDQSSLRPHTQTSQEPSPGCYSDSDESNQWHVTLFP
jgi:hypothetical protein